VVPILIVSTTSTVRDAHPTDDITLSSICTFHGVQPENIVILNSRSTAPMIDISTAGEFNKAVHDWIDNLG
jgi:hypothetical protein